MKQLLLNKDSFTEVSTDVFIRGEDKKILETPIFRYQNIASFYQLLKGNIYIPMRREFSDQHEHGNNYNPFNQCMLSSGCKITSEDKKIWEIEKENRKLISHWHTLCFTLNTDENYFLWKTYTNSFYGIRFKTTVQKLIDSITFTGYELYIGNIKYVPDKSEPMCYNIEEYAFSKTKSYKNEEELRIYFLPKTEYNHSQEEISMKNEPLFFDVIPENMIEQLWLSPFLPEYIRSFTIDFLRVINPEIADRIVHSRIIEQLSVS